MSDVGIAPPPQAPVAEVPINENPVSAPTPVGSQAPPLREKAGDKPAGRPESRRESIQKAFDKANERNEAAPKRAKPGVGHNQPPEETPKEKLELRQPPREVHREGGRFARAPENQEGQPRQPGQTGQPGQPGQSRQVTPLPETAPYRDPPQRFSERGQAEWAAAPEGVRGAVHQMAKEFDGAYRQYRADNETMNSIRHFHDMATQHGTTLDRALSNYVGMEQKLRQDVVGGLDVIVNNLNLRTSEGQKIGLRDIAYHVLSQSPEQLKMMQQGNAQTAASHQIGALHQELTGLKQAISQMHNQQQFTYTRSAVDQFADAHPRFDELGDLIEAELNAGYDLTTAYRRAELLRPATHAAQTRNSTPAQTRSNRSISGAPDTGPSDGQRRNNGKPIGRRDAIQNAIRRVNGGA